MSRTLKIVLIDWLMSDNLTKWAKGFLIRGISFVGDQSSALPSISISTKTVSQRPCSPLPLSIRSFIISTTSRYFNYGLAFRLKRGNHRLECSIIPLPFDLVLNVLWPYTQVCAIRYTYRGLESVKGCALGTCLCSVFLEPAQQGRSLFTAYDIFHFSYGRPQKATPSVNNPHR